MDLDDQLVDLVGHRADQSTTTGEIDAQAAMVTAGSGLSVSVVEATYWRGCAYGLVMPSSAAGW